MNKGYQLEQLRRLLVNPALQSGLYLIDTDLSDEEIEEYLKNFGICSYEKESLFPPSEGSAFEMFVIGLSYKCNDAGISILRQQLFAVEGRRRGGLIYSLVIEMIGLICRREISVLHVNGELDLSSLSHEELCILKESMAHHDKRILVLSKDKNDVNLDCDNIIQKVSLKEQKYSFSFMGKGVEKVHITYKHDDEHEEALEAIISGLGKSNIPYSIDKYDILYRTSIDEYEKEIGLADRVIMFVIPDYLKSLDCMFEMTEIFKNGHVIERTYPVVDLGKMKRKGDSLKELKDYWHNEMVRKLEQMKSEPGGSEFVMQETSKINTIISTLDKFWIYICRYSTGQYEKLIENDAALLIEELNKTWPKESGLIDENFVPSDDTKPAGFRTVIQNGNGSVYIENSTGPIIIGGDRETGNVALKNEAYFNDIANQIIRDLDGARVSIHVAIAWFTNQRIADKLVEKFKDGLDVKVVYFKDHTNSKFGVNIDNIPFKAIRGTRGGTMHNKFCVIDNQKVITGSYNWSENAENKNDENAAVMYDNDCASSYSVEFRRLFALA